MRKRKKAANSCSFCLFCKFSAFIYLFYALNGICKDKNKRLCAVGMTMCLFLQSYYATMRVMCKDPLAYNMRQPAERAGKVREMAALKTISDARMKVRALPEAQKRIFLLMCDFWTVNDQLPALQTIADRMGYRSVNAAQQAVSALESKGLLERNEAHRLRFIRVDGVNLGEVFRHGSIDRVA